MIDAGAADWVAARSHEDDHRTRPLFTLGGPGKLGELKGLVCEPFRLAGGDSCLKEFEMIRISSGDFNPYLIPSKRIRRKNAATRQLSRQSAVATGHSRISASP